MIKLEVEMQEDLWRILDLLRQMGRSSAVVGLAVLCDGLTEPERLSILYLVRCKEVEATEYDKTVLKGQ